MELSNLKLAGSAHEVTRDNKKMAKFFDDIVKTVNKIIRGV